MYTKQLNIKISNDQFERIRIYCFENKVSHSKFMRIVIDNALANAPSIFNNTLDINDL